MYNPFHAKPFPSSSRERGLPPFSICLDLHPPRTIRNIHLHVIAYPAARRPGSDAAQRHLAAAARHAIAFSVRELDGRHPAEICRARVGEDTERAAAGEREVEGVRESIIRLDGELPDVVDVPEVDGVAGISAIDDVFSIALAEPECIGACSADELIALRAAAPHGAAAAAGLEIGGAARIADEDRVAIVGRGIEAVHAPNRADAEIGRRSTGALELDRAIAALRDTLERQGVRCGIGAQIEVGA